MKKRADGRYVETFTDEKTGKRKYIYGSSPKIVKEKLRNYEEELKNAVGYDGKTFREVAEEWKEIHDKEVEYATQIAYRPGYKQSLEYFGGRLVKDITPADVKKYIAMIANKGFAHATVNIYLVVIRMIFDHAIYLEEISSNPVTTVKIPKGLSKKERDVPPEEYIEIIKDNVHSGQMGLFAYFLLYSGLRKSEALALQWRDINLEKKTITVNKIVEYIINKPRIKNSTKTKASTRNVILLDKLADTLKQYKGNDNIYIFKGSGGLYKRGEFHKRWGKYCSETGMIKDGKNDITPHQLRHAYVTMLYESDIDAESAMLMTGHSNIATMRNIYTHIREKKLEEVAEKLNKNAW